MMIAAMTEMWLPIRGFDYEVSSAGRVRRATAFRQFPAGYVVRTRPDRDGYPMVSISRDGEYRYAKVSVLVCEAFHGPKPTPRHHAAHSNGDKSDNRADNLSWKTPVENQADKRLHGTIPVGDKASQSILNEAEVLAMRKDRAAGMTLKAIAEKYGRARLTAYDAITGRTWKHVPSATEARA